MKCIVLHIPTGKYLAAYTFRYRGGALEEYTLSKIPFVFGFPNGYTEQMLHDHCNKTGYYYDTIESSSELLIINQGE